MHDQWDDPDAPWLAKLRRAAKHIDDVEQLIQEYLSTQPWYVTQQPGRVEAEWSYVLRVECSLSPDVITVVGDALHNLRSSLDAVAYALAVDHLGRPLTTDEEALPAFPVCRNAEELEEWLKRKRKGVVRRSLYGPRQVEAIECVQPYVLRQEGERLGLDSATSEDAEFRYHDLARLDTLWNIDKHRRLPLVVLALDVVYWSGNPAYKWHPNTGSPGGFGDGDIIGWLRSDTGSAAPPPTLVHKIEVCLGDDIPGRALVTQLRSWHERLAGWVLPRMIAMARGAAARPILITRL